MKCLNPHAPVGDATQASRALVRYLIERVERDDEFAYYCAWGTRLHDLLVEAGATLFTDTDRAELCARLLEAKTRNPRDAR